MHMRLCSRDILLTRDVSIHRLHTSNVHAVMHVKITMHHALPCMHVRTSVSRTSCPNDSAMLTILVLGVFYFHNTIHNWFWSRACVVHTNLLTQTLEPHINTIKIKKLYERYACIHTHTHTHVHVHDEYIHDRCTTPEAAKTGQSIHILDWAHAVCLVACKEHAFAKLFSLKRSLFLTVWTYFHCPLTIKLNKIIHRCNDTMLLSYRTGHDHSAYDFPSHGWNKIVCAIAHWEEMVRLATNPRESHQNPPQSF